MNQGIIYSIYNKQTNKYYIGQTTKDLNKRWKEHIYQATTDNQAPLYRSIRKHGIENFKIKVIEECNCNILDVKETHWIEQYDSCSNGYNQSEQYTITEEVKSTISKSKREERVEKIIAALKNKGHGFSVRGDGKHHRMKVKTINADTLDETYYDSITECAQGLNVPIPHVSRALKNGWKVHGHRIIRLENKTQNHPVYGVDKITNQIKYTFPSIRAAASKLGSYGGCHKSLKHPHKYTWKGCYWFYQ